MGSLCFSCTRIPSGYERKLGRHGESSSAAGVFKLLINVNIVQILVDLYCEKYFQHTQIFRQSETEFEKGLTFITEANVFAKQRLQADLTRHCYRFINSFHDRISRQKAASVITQAGYPNTKFRGEQIQNSDFSYDHPIRDLKLAL